VPSALERVAVGLLFLELALLFALWLLPSPAPSGVPGREPRIVVGS